LNYIFNCGFLAYPSSSLPSFLLPPPSPWQRVPSYDKNKRETVFRRRRRRRPPSPPWNILTPSAPASAYRAPSPALSLPAYTLPRTGANFCPLPLRRPVFRFPPPFPAAAAARLHGPPLFSVQQVARSFKTCRRSFVRFKKPKHRQSSALRRQERYLRREELPGVVCRAGREAGGYTTRRRLFRQLHPPTRIRFMLTCFCRHFYPR